MKVDRLRFPNISSPHPSSSSVLELYQSIERHFSMDIRIDPNALEGYQRNHSTDIQELHNHNDLVDHGSFLFDEC